MDVTHPNSGYTTCTDTGHTYMHVGKNDTSTPCREPGVCVRSGAGNKVICMCAKHSCSPPPPWSCALRALSQWHRPAETTAHKLCLCAHGGSSLVRVCTVRTVEATYQSLLVLLLLGLVILLEQLLDLQGTCAGTEVMARRSRGWGRCDSSLCAAWGLLPQNGSLSSPARTLDILCYL